MRDDAIRANGGDIGAGRRHVPYYRDHGLAGGETTDVIVENFRARRRATGAFDRQQHGGRMRGGDVVDELERFPVAGDDALDGDARDMRGQPAAARARKAPRAGAERHDDGQRGGDAPEGQLAPQASAIDEVIGGGVGEVGHARPDSGSGRKHIPSWRQNK